MKISKKLTALALAVSAAFCCFAFPVSADETTAEEETSQSDSPEKSDDGYIKGEDYNYSLTRSSDGNTYAYLEAYTGDDTKVVIPETIDDYTVKGLGDVTFYENEKITEITISENLEEFGNFPFYGCTSLKEFKVNKNNKLYKTDKDGAIISKDGTSLMAYPTGKNPEKYTVADGIKGIKSGTFAVCTNLKEITFPDTVDFIGIYAFAKCTSLESIVLPDNLTELSDFTFSSCTSLKNVTLPKNLQTIDNAVFFDCKALELIDFPPTLTEIGQAAFCSTGITSIEIPPTILSIGYSAFGFHTNEKNDIVADENFVIKGYNESYAQRYCSENSIDFISLDEPETEAAATTLNTEKKGGIKPGIIVGICIICVVLAIGLITALGLHTNDANTTSKKKKSVDSGEADDEKETDNTEEEE